MGVGNIVGSNMANLGLVVAVAGLVGNLRVPGGLLRRELPLVVAATAGFALAVQDGLTRTEGALLAVGLVVALTIVVRRSAAPDGPGRSELGIEVDEFLAEEAARPTWRLVLDAAAGLAGTVVALARHRSVTRGEAVTLLVAYLGLVPLLAG